MLGLGPLRFGVFLAPHHDPSISPTRQLRRDLDLIELLDDLGYDEVWVGEHHSGGHEIIGSPEMLLAAAGERTRRIRLGTGVNSLPYHNPLILADRIVQLDHMTGGRAMLGMGPGQLPTDAFMLGIDPRAQRDMMIEAAEVIVALLAGEVVTRTTSWFDLHEAHLQLPPCNPDGIEVSVASAVSPTGAVLAGRLGLGMLSLAATDPRGYSALDVNWGFLERAASEAGHTADRSRWRILAGMHLSDSVQQARREVEHGILGSVVGYIESLTAERLPWASSAADAVAKWTGDGIPGFGVATVGTPADAVATIGRLSERSGGFGTLLLLAHDCASWVATRRSFELFAEEVIPELRGLNAARRASREWSRDNSATFLGAMRAAIVDAVARYPSPGSGAAPGPGGPVDSWLPAES